MDLGVRRRWDTAPCDTYRKLGFQKLEKTSVFLRLTLRFGVTPGCTVLCICVSTLDAPYESLTHAQERPRFLLDAANRLR